MHVASSAVNSSTTSLTSVKSPIVGSFAEIFTRTPLASLRFISSSSSLPTAVGSELLEDINLKDARGVLVNISAKDPTMGDFTEVSEVVEEFTADDATCIYGLVIDPSLKDELMVTIVATGVNQKSPKLWRFLINSCCNYCDH